MDTLKSLFVLVGIVYFIGLLVGYYICYSLLTVIISTGSYALTAFIIVKIKGKGA